MFIMILNIDKLIELLERKKKRMEFFNNFNLNKKIVFFEKLFFSIQKLYSAPDSIPEVSFNF